MRIPEHIIDQVRETADIVQIVEQSVTLKKRGRNYLGLCPFHNEKTPSFNVNAEGGFFKCFGCGKGGNVFNFVMDHYHLTFPEAVRHVANLVGIDIPEEQGNPELEKNIESVHAVLRCAQEYYVDNFRSTPNPAHSYVSGRRFSDEAIRVFGVGYSPDAWEKSKEHCLKQGFAEQIQIDAGLLIEKEQGGTYDRFRGRLMFPIHSKSGRVIGFGARQLTEDKKQPKYINSPQTIVYDKSKVLYGLYQAKESMRELGYAVLTEGYADVISLWQHGIKNAVASSGTALTPQQVQVLKRSLSGSSNATQADIYVVYDADSAGAKAAMKAVALMLQQGLEVRVVSLPAGEDPDSFVQKHGSAGFLQAITNAQTYIQCAKALLEKAGMWENSTAKRRALEQLLQNIAAVGDGLLRDQLLQETATEFGFSRETLIEETKRIVEENNRKQERRDRYQQMAPQMAPQLAPEPYPSDYELDPTASAPVPEPEPEAELDSSEQAILYSIVMDERVRGYLQKIGLSESDFITEAGAALYRVILQAPSGQWQSAVEQSDELKEHHRKAARKALQPPAEASKSWTQFEVEIRFNPRKFVDDALHTMKKRRMHNELNDTRRALASATESEQIQLLRKLQELRAELSTM